MSAAGGASEPAPQLVVRVPYVVALLTTLWLVVFGTAATTALAAGSPLGIALGVTLIVIGAVVAVRSCRSALLVDETGLTVRNAWRTRSWPWEAVGEFGWDTPAWNRFAGPIRAIAVCPLGDSYVYTASATAADPERTARHSAALDPILAEHGVTNSILNDVASTYRWPSDPRSRSGASTP